MIIYYSAILVNNFFWKFDAFFYYESDNDAGWSSLEARRAHNPKVTGSNPVPATRSHRSFDYMTYAQIAQLVEQRTENPRVTGSIPVLGIFICHRFGRWFFYLQKMLF